MPRNTSEPRALRDEEGDQELLQEINRLGNCSLFEKTFNISKSDKTLRTFLADVHEFKSMTRQVTNRPGFSSFPSEMSDGSPHGWLPWAQHRPNSGENPLETELRPERIAWKPTAPTCVPQYQNGEIERESSPVSNVPGH